MFCDSYIISIDNFIKVFAMSRFILSLCLFAFTSPVFAIDQDEMDLCVERTALATYNRIHQKDLWHFPKPNKNSEHSDRLIELGWKPTAGSWCITAPLSLIEDDRVIEIRLTKPKDMPLTQALDDLENNDVGMECALGVNYVKLRCLQALIGDSVLNNLCKEWETQNDEAFHISNWQYNPLSILFLERRNYSFFDWGGRGAIGVIANDPLYNSEIVHVVGGAGSNLNVIQVGQTGENQSALLLGFSANMYKTPITPETARSCLEKDFNRGARLAKTGLTWNPKSIEEANEKVCLFKFSADLINSFLEKKKNYEQALKDSPLANIQKKPKILGN